MALQLLRPLQSQRLGRQWQELWKVMGSSSGLPGFAARRPLRLLLQPEGASSSRRRAAGDRAGPAARG
eukprot:1543079-Pyramimonas_sp.AAC.1